MTTQNKLLNLKLNKLASVFKDYPFLTEEWHECAADRADVDFIFEQLTKVPDPIKRIILNNAFKLKVRKKRNLYVLNTTNMIVKLLPEKLRYSLTVDDDEIRVIAKNCADRCRRIALHHNVNGRMNPLTEKAVTGIIVNGTSRYVTKHVDPLTEICHSNVNDILKIFNDYADSFRIEAIVISEKGATELGAIKASTLNSRAACNIEEII
jgi:hypothetical protein